MALSKLYNNGIRDLMALLLDKGIHDVIMIIMFIFSNLKVPLFICYCTTRKVSNKDGISDGSGDGKRLSDFRSSLINWRRIQRQKWRHTFLAGGKWRAGGGDGIKNPSPSATDFPSPHTWKKKFEPSPFRCCVYFLKKIKLLFFDQIRTYKSFPARNLQDLRTQSTSNDFE